MKLFHQDEPQNPEIDITGLSDHQRPYQNRPDVKDEMAVNIDGILSADPAAGLHERAQKFVSSRQWTTPSIFYSNQPEPGYPKEMPMWSMSFCAGLDHVPKTGADWFADIAAIIRFVHTVAHETGCVFSLEFQQGERSETIAFIDDDPDHKVGLKEIRSTIERLIKRRSCWWRRLLCI